MEATPRPVKLEKSVFTAWLSLVVAIIVLSLKYIGYLTTHSEAIFSDAMESVVNIITAIVAALVMRAVVEPADTEHPYGHGKLEYFSSAFEGGMIVFAALVIAAEAIKALLHMQNPERLEKGIGFIAAATFLNIAMSIYLAKVGKKQKSEALKASAAHLMADVWTTIGVAAGLLLVKVTGWQWLDPAIALVVAATLIASGYKIVRRAVGVLMDEMDADVISSLCVSLEKFRKPGLIDVHNTRMIRSGKFHHIDAHLVVPEFWDVLKVHNEAQDFEAKVVEDYPFDAEFAFHIDPCRKEFCTQCNLLDCPIRVEPFIKVKAFDVNSVVSDAKAGLE